MVRVMKFEKLTIDGNTTYKISGKEVDEDTYDKLINDDEFEKVNIVKQDFELEPESTVHIVGNSDDITVDHIPEKELIEYIDGCDIPGVVGQIQQMDYESAVESLKVFIAQIICQAQEMAYDDISKIASKRSAMKSIERETIDALAMEDDE
jgi:hypothetical protein